MTEIITIQCSFCDSTTSDLEINEKTWRVTLPLGWNIDQHENIECPACFARLHPGGTLTPKKESPEEELASLKKRLNKLVKRWEIEVDDEHFQDSYVTGQALEDLKKAIGGKS